MTTDKSKEKENVPGTDSDDDAGKYSPEVLSVLMKYSGPHADGAKEPDPADLEDEEGGEEE